MHIEKKRLSGRNILIQRPEFSPGENPTRKEIRAVQNMNDFYRSMTEAIVAYGAETAEKYPLALYIMNAEWEIVPGSTTVAPVKSNDAPTLSSASNSQEEFSLHEIVRIRISLSLRLRSEPTRRRNLTQTWERGFLKRNRRAER